MLSSWALTRLCVNCGLWEETGRTVHWRGEPSISGIIQLIKHGVTMSCCYLSHRKKRGSWRASPFLKEVCAINKQNGVWFICFFESFLNLITCVSREVLLHVSTSEEMQAAIVHWWRTMLGSSRSNIVSIFTRFLNWVVYFLKLNGKFHFLRINVFSRYLGCNCVDQTLILMGEEGC